MGYSAETVKEKETYDQIKPLVMEYIARFIRGINYGEVIITIHDSKVVQIEKREKTRFSD